MSIAQVLDGVLNELLQGGEMNIGRSLDVQTRAPRLELAEVLQELSVLL